LDENKKIRKGEEKKSLRLSSQFQQRDVVCTCVIAHHPLVARLLVAFVHLPLPLHHYGLTVNPNSGEKKNDRSSMTVHLLSYNSNNKILSFKK
jgi:hypothetical protein